MTDATRDRIVDNLAAAPRPELSLVRVNRRRYLNVIDERVRLRTRLLLHDLGVEGGIDELHLACRLANDHAYRARLEAIGKRTDLAQILASIREIEREEDAELIAMGTVNDERCVRCGCDTTDADRPIPRGRACEACWTHFHTAPSSPPKHGIRSAIGRARRARLPATLTIEQWNATVKHFADRCAFCGGPWCLVEHADPIELGGGTTVSNCLPACAACNITKGKRTLLDWWKALGVDHLLSAPVERALEWLEQRSASSVPKPPTKRTKR